MPIENPTVSTFAGEGTQALMNMPASSSGDRLIAWIAFDGGTNVDPINGEWTQVRRENYLTLFGLVAYEKNASAAEPSSYTWSFQGVTAKWSGGIAVYPGAGAVSVFVGRAEEHGVRNFKTEPITTTSADNRVTSILAQRSPSLYDAPTGWTKQGESRSGATADNVSSTLIDISKATAGLQGEATATARVFGDCYYFQRDGEPVSGDAIVQNRLQALGFSVTTADQDTNPATALADANASDLIFVSESIFSSRIDRLIGTTSPMIVAEPFVLDDLNFTGTVSNTDFGLNNANPQVEIVSNHPLSADLSGQFNLYGSGSRVSWGLPHNLADAELAVKEVGADRYYQFGFEEGATLRGGASNSARSVSTFIIGATSLTSQGEALIDAAIDWAVRSRPSPQIVLMLALPEASGVQPIDVNLNSALTSAPEIGRTTIEQQPTVVLQSVLAPAPEIGRLTASQRHTIVLQPALAPAPEIGRTDITQQPTIALQPALAPTPEIGRLTASQQHAITLQPALAPVPEVGRTDITQVLLIGLNSALAPAPEIGRLTVNQIHSVQLQSEIALSPEIGRSDISQALTITLAAVLASPPEIETIAITQNHAFSGLDILSAPPEIGRLALLSSNEIDVQSALSNSPEIGRLQISQLHTISLNAALTPSPEISRITLTSTDSVSLQSALAPPPEIGRLDITQGLAIPLTPGAALSPEIGRLSVEQEHALILQSVISSAPEVGRLTLIDPLIPIAIDIQPVLAEPPEVSRSFISQIEIYLPPTGTLEIALDTFPVGTLENLALEQN